MGTFIQGIGASENIDTSGERLSIAGMDVSSLDQDGVFTYEHELAKVPGPDGKMQEISIKIPSQVVGKILKCKKIFSDKDCDDDHQLYFWNKIKTPYLYVMGELFDDYTEAAKDLAGKFRYDADKKQQNDRPVMNFSVEGGKIEKTGIDVMRSVARKITITVFPCNKAAIAEMVQVDQKPKNDLDLLFKTEFVEIELFPLIKEEGAPMSAGGLMMNSERHLKVASHPSKRGTKMGTTRSGKDVYSHGMIGEYDNFSHDDHFEAADMHQKSQISTPDFHAQKSKLHRSVGVKLKDRHNLKLNKAETAGSGLAAPDKLTGTAALTRESLEKSFGGVKIKEAPKPPPMKPVTVKVPSNPNDLHNQKFGKSDSVNNPIYSNSPSAKDASSQMVKAGEESKPLADRESGPKTAPGMKTQVGLTTAGGSRHKVRPNRPDRAAKVAGKQMNPTHTQSPPKPTKSGFLARAEHDYAHWEKREKFEEFMKKRMPSLTKGEIQVIGQTMLLQKSLKVEKALTNVTSIKKETKK